MVDKSLHRVFIVGAGFSHHLSGCRFPMGSCLAEAVRALAIPEIDKHYQECHHTAPHLEEVLTRFDLDGHVSADRKDAIRRKIFRAVQEKLTVKSLNGSDLDRSKKLVRNLFGAGDTIITTNYDLLLEHLLDQENMWCPLGNGYGNAVEGDDNMPPEKDDEVNQKRGNIRILKVHGSFNFFQEKLVSGGTSQLITVLVNETHNDFLDRDDLFQSVKYNHHCVGKKADNLKSLVLPTFVKPFSRNRTAMKIWHEACDVMRTASTVTVIGYSFPEPDQMMNFLVSCPNANEYKQKMDKLSINILDTQKNVRQIQGRICRYLRANPEKDVNWASFELNTQNPDQAYNQLVGDLQSESSRRNQ